MTSAIAPFRAALGGAHADAGADARVRAVIDAHYESLWRFLRRMGVEADQVEDAAQIVLLVFAQRSSEIDRGAVPSFLFGTALRVASDFRRRSARSMRGVEWAQVDERPHPCPDAEQQLEQRQLRRWLDRVLDELVPELRAVFVLAELEEMTMVEIAKVLSIPPGTVASRLRRAREIVATKAGELRAQVESAGCEAKP